jgi:hypothetical protein
MFARIKNSTSRAFMRNIICSSAFALALLCSSRPANSADVKYPTEADLRGFQTACAGGNVKEVKGQLDGALKAWRLNPGAQLGVDGAIRDLGAIIEKIKSGSDGNLYESYVNCVQKLIQGHLQHVNAANPTPAIQRASDKPR